MSAAASFSHAVGFPRHTFFELGLNRGQTLTDLLTSKNTERNLLKPLLKSLMHGRDFKHGRGPSSGATSPALIRTWVTGSGTNLLTQVRW